MTMPRPLAAKRSTRLRQAPYKVAAAKEAKAKEELDKLRNADTPDKDAIANKSTEVFQDGNVTSKLDMPRWKPTPLIPPPTKSSRTPTACLPLFAASSRSH